MRIIDDRNYLDFINEQRDAGWPAGAIPREKDGRKPLKVGHPLSEDMRLIPENEWEDRIKYMTTNKMWIADRIKFNPKDHYQNGLGYCWAYSLAQAVEAERVRGGQDFQLLAPESLGEDVRWRNAGNYLDSAIQYAAKNGIARRQLVPQHELNSNRFDPQWKEDRKNFVPLEWWDLGGNKVWAQTVTALLSGFGCYVGLDWWSHAVFYAKLVLDGKKIGVWTPNSHGEGEDVILYGSRAVPSMDSYVLRSVTFQRLAAYPRRKSDEVSSNSMCCDDCHRSRQCHRSSRDSGGR